MAAQAILAFGVLNGGSLSRVAGENVGVYGINQGGLGLGATVTLTDGNGNPIGQVTADGSGNWSFTASTRATWH